MLVTYEVTCSHLLAYVDFSEVLEEAQHCHVQPLPRILLVPLLVHACRKTARVVGVQIRGSWPTPERKGLAAAVVTTNAMTQLDYV
jgi:hypothetical protein